MCRANGGGGGTIRHSTTNNRRRHIDDDDDEEAVAEAAVATAADVSSSDSGNNTAAGSGSCSPIISPPSPPTSNAFAISTLLMASKSSPLQRRRCSSSALLLLPLSKSSSLHHHQRMFARWRLPRLVGASRLCSLLLTSLLLLAIWRVWLWGERNRQRTTVIVITPTHKRPERLADMTRFSQTLMHVPDLHWIVIEDANATVPAVERILERSKIPYTYFYATTKPGFPRRGWTHRNVALEYIRKNYVNYRRNAVVYFADDDNTYDTRLFEQYIKRVKSIGIWAVGLAGGAQVEAPHVVNGTITGWDVVYAPQRRFAVDMAGFAINLKLILHNNATFHLGCVKFSPESCFLAQFQIPREKAEPFGWQEQPKEILVWHTKTKNIGTKGSDHGYVVEQ